MKEFQKENMKTLFHILQMSIWTKLMKPSWDLEFWNDEHSLPNGGLPVSIELAAFFRSKGFMLDEMT